MTIALDIIKGALRRINSYQSGESIAAPDEQDCLDTFNDLLDSWSTDKLHIFGSNENIFNWVSGQRLYKIGNPACTLVGSQPFTGTLTITTNTITGVTNVPANLAIGATLTDLQNVIPAGTTVTNIAGTTVTMSANATSSSVGLDTITYTVPGDFAISRPLRITHGFTRFNQLDFTLDVCATQDQYTSILYKAQPGPWPTVAWYNNQFPYGLLNVYQTPGNGAEVHLFTDTILSNLTLTSTLVMPQGYTRALKWALAKEMWAEYKGDLPMPDALKVNAANSLEMIKALNALPAPVARYDRELVRGNRPDGGWILRGGY